jgi:hypothetical protein
MALMVTIEELARMENLGLVVWATPSPDGIAQQAYVASRPQWRDDFLLATPADFLAAQGYDSLGWDEMTEEARAQCAHDMITITVQRTRAPSMHTTGS